MWGKDWKSGGQLKEPSCSLKIQVKNEDCLDGNGHGLVTGHLEQKYCISEHGHRSPESNFPKWVVSLLWGCWDHEVGDDCSLGCNCGGVCGGEGHLLFVRLKKVDQPMSLRKAAGMHCLQ